jgi:hypothetical protein
MNPPPLDALLLPGAAAVLRQVADRRCWFDDVAAFRAELRSRPVPDSSCWGCSAGGMLVAFNVHKDFKSLDVSPDGCPVCLSLCWDCSTAYMNSFNGALAQKPKRRR